MSMDTLPHGSKVVKGEAKFTVPKPNFVIEPLPAEGTYALVVNSIRQGRNFPKSVHSITADEWTKVNGLTPYTEVYVSGVSADYEFYVRW